jgi:hypothetical protein
VDTVGTITATAGYSITDNHSPTASSLTSSIEFPGDHDTSKDSSSSVETYSPGADSRSTQSLGLRNRQARGKPSQWQSSGSVEEKDPGIATFPLTDHHVSEQLYNVKPQTFDIQSSQSTDIKSDESVEKTIAYNKKMQKNDGHDDRPVFTDWSEEIRMKFDNDKPIRSRRKNKNQQDSVQQEKRKQQMKKLTSGNTDKKDGWQELTPNMEMATGIITTVPDHDSSQDTSGSSGTLKNNYKFCFLLIHVQNIFE